MWVLIVVLAFGVNLVAREAGQPPFALNAKKPYVYLEFDHVGQRKPAGPDESNQGMWLRLVNNCRLPIAVRTFDKEGGETGVGVEDEVVPISGPWGLGSLEKTLSSARTTLSPPERDIKQQPPGLPNRLGAGTEAMAVRASPGAGEEGARPKAAYELAEPPIGYGSEFATVRTVYPGENVLFSVPVEHVSPRWYLRVRFTLVVSPAVRGDREPYSYVEFHWNELPEDVRSQKP